MFYRQHGEVKTVSDKPTLWKNSHIAPLINLTNGTPWVVLKIIVLL